MSKLTIDIDKDVIGYSRKHENEIIHTSLILFDIWINILFDNKVDDQVPKEHGKIKAQKYDINDGMHENKNVYTHSQSITPATQ